MRLDLVVYDAHGKTRGYACLRLDLDQCQWFVESDDQRAWQHAGFSDCGPFEVKDDDLIWLWEREVGNPKQNTAVLTDIPTIEMAAGQTGTGRIVTGNIRQFHGGTLHWTIVEQLPAPAPASVLVQLTSRMPGIALAPELPAA
ncbi:hypothetical protein FHP25_26505 [Vineibacter terrae]|uniref:Uncharacterized protein n=1 Tax=Vineibacter terrae TaxID=2586908 RepID=A0A5C8PFV7_9HYPH|nr:hypothetical protein [Vineibacter terrae]TXL72184.1 hypothetical protein FHP25_26505 [Vineibacter terrae]